MKDLPFDELFKLSQSDESEFLKRKKELLENELNSMDCTPDQKLQLQTLIDSLCVQTKATPEEHIANAFGLMSESMASLKEGLVELNVQRLV